MHLPASCRSQQVHQRYHWPCCDLGTFMGSSQVETALLWRDMPKIYGRELQHWPTDPDV